MREYRIPALAVIVLTCLIITGCKPRYNRTEPPFTGNKPDQEAIIRSNQLNIKRNAEKIRQEASKRGWKLTETGTGVFYQIYTKHGKNPPARIVPMDWVSLTYKVGLLDGTECYSSKDQGLKQFVVEKSEAEAGLHEVVQLLTKGDSALVVIPPHRAFGVAGDGNRIPPGAVLVYEIRVDSVNRHRID